MTPDVGAARRLIDAGRFLLPGAAVNFAAYVPGATLSVRLEKNTVPPLVQ